jgi:Phage Tail Collar Domain
MRRRNPWTTNRTGRPSGRSGRGMGTYILFIAVNSAEHTLIANKGCMSPFFASFFAQSRRIVNTLKADERQMVLHLLIEGKAPGQNPPHPAEKVVNLLRRGSFFLMLLATHERPLPTADSPPIQKENLMDQFMGEIRLFALNYAPPNWAPCEGQLLHISQNTAVFTLLGTEHGGDGHTTFALPNLKGKAPGPNMHYCIALQGAYPPRS